MKLFKRFKRTNGHNKMSRNYGTTPFAVCNEPGTFLNNPYDLRHETINAMRATLLSNETGEVEICADIDDEIKALKMTQEQAQDWLFECLIELFHVIDATGGVDGHNMCIRSKTNIQQAIKASKAQ